MAIVFRSDWLIIVNCIFGLLVVFSQSKAKIINRFFGVVYFGFYVALAYMTSYYGEVIVYLVLFIPLYAYGIFHWLRHKDKDDKSVVIVRNNLPKVEWLVALQCLVLIGVGTYFLLGWLNTAQLIVSTLSIVAIIFAEYTLTRRLKFNQFAFLVNDIVFGVLWFLAVLGGNTALIPFAVMCAFFIMFDAYGIFQWIKLERKQKEKRSK